MIDSLSLLFDKKYWNKANTVEFVSFMIKLIIVFPGLIWGYQWWWLYVFAFLTSLSLIWSSTVKTHPTLIIFNFGWMILSIVVIINHFV